MSKIVNPWSLGDEIVERFRIPDFTKSKYMVTEIKPPKNKTIRDGLVMHAVLIDFTDSEGKTTVMTEVAESPEGFKVTFPNGKYAITATKYRGPTSWYRFLSPTTGKWNLIPKEKFTVDFATNFLSTSVQNWDSMNETEKDVLIDEYFENMYMFGLACDFGFDTTGETYEIPKPGMVTSFYRRYTPPVGDNKYGNTIITKWPNKKDASEKEYDSLPSDFVMTDSNIVNAIVIALQQRDDNKIDTSNEVADSPLPF